MIEETLLWKAVREEVRMNMDSENINATSEEIREITTRVINDEFVWQTFNDHVMDIIREFKR